MKVAKRPARGRNSHSLLLLVNCLVDNITRPSLVRRSNPIYRLQGAAELAPCDYMMKFILALRSNSLAQWPASGRDLHCVAYGAGFSLKLPLLYPIAKVIPRLRRKVTRKRAKAKLVWAFAASVSNLSKGQRWEVQRAAEQCAETGGMMFERSEFLPPQVLRQTATGEVRTDWRILQQRMLLAICEQRKHRMPDTAAHVFWYLFFKKSTERKTWRKIRVND